MTALEIIRSMNEEQARKALQALRAGCEGDIEGATAVMKTMTIEGLDALIALLEAATPMMHEGGTYHDNAGRSR